jgi:hypothetical protein
MVKFASLHANSPSHPQESTIFHPEAQLISLRGMSTISILKTTMDCKEALSLKVVLQNCVICRILHGLLLKISP